MDSCVAVDRELDKVLSKFSGVQEHSVNTIDDFITSIENIRKELGEGICKLDISEEIMKFITSYLEKYFRALFVYNLHLFISIFGLFGSD